MTLPLDLAPTIMKYIPYADQFRFRMACKRFNSIPLTLEQISDQPTIREIAYYVFFYRPLTQIQYIHQYFFRLKDSVRSIYLDRSMSHIWRSKYKNGKLVGHDFKSVRGLISYLNGYHLDYLYRKSYASNCFQVILCKQILENRIVCHHLSHMLWDRFAGCALFDLCVKKMSVNTKFLIGRCLLCQSSECMIKCI